MRPTESFIGQPIRSLQTMLRTISEYDGSVPTLVPDGIYGNETRDAVTIFQRKNSLPATGVTDQETWKQISDQYDNALIYVAPVDPIEIILDPNQVFVLGDISPYLFLAQGMLLYLSTQHKEINEPGRNGILDRQTANALSSFQRLNKLEETGNLDRKTWKNLSKQFTLNANRQQNHMLNNL